MSKLEQLLPKLYEELHAAGAFKGESWRWHEDKLVNLLAFRPSGPILDYGCGPQGGLLRSSRVPGRKIAYDPYVPEYAEDPWKKDFDVFFTSDVLEHLTEDMLLDLVRRLVKHKRIKYLCLGVTARAANKHFSNGTNVHLTIRPAAWWHGFFSAQLGPHFEIISAEHDLLGDEVNLCYIRKEPEPT